MYKTVKNLLDTSSVWNGFSAFETAFTSFGDKLSQLETIAYGQTLALVGVKNVKVAKRAEAAKRTVEVAGALMAFASANGDVALQTMMKISESSIKFSAAQKSLQLIDAVIEQANIHINELGDFGIDQSMLSALETLRDELDIIFNSPRQAIVGRKAMTTKLDELVGELDALLKNQLDKLALLLDAQDHTFYLNYKAARVIVDLKPAQSGGEEGNVPPNSGAYEG